MVFRSPKLPSPLFCVLDWIRIVCWGCFGTCSQRPRSVQPSPFSMLSKLDLKTSGVQEDDQKSKMAHPRPDIKSLAWKFADEPHVGLGNDEDDDTAAPAENDSSDGMFHGLFYLGSKVLTEVEMQSPVEESKIIATPLRTPRRSNNSSLASSTRELDFGSSQVCLVDFEFSSSSDAIAVVSPCRYFTQSMPPSCTKTSFPCCKKPKSGRMCLSSSCEQMDHILTVLSTEDNSAKQGSKSGLGNFTPLYKHEGQDLKPNDSIARHSLCRESNRKLNEEIMQPSLESSPEETQFSQSGTLWNNRRCQVRVGSSSPECRMVNPSAVSDRLQAEIPVGSLPDASKINIAGRGWRKDNEGGQRTRSLTDEDFNELRGCIDLGFVFTQDHIPDLCETLPALEVCYAIAHGPVSPVYNQEDSKSVSPGSPPISPWKVASPGDEPQQVKTRLRHWAQAVACNLRQAH